MSERSFGLRVAKLREERGLTLRELAKAARMHPARLSRVERGEFGNLPQELVQRLAESLGMSREEFDLRTRGLVSHPMRPSIAPREVLQLINAVQWNQQKVAEFRALAERWRAAGEGAAGSIDESVEMASIIVQDS